MSNMYAMALAAYLRRTGTSQQKFADKAGCFQPAICRFTTGRNLPEKSLAKRIEAVTNGEVPFKLWQQAKIEQLGVFN